MQSHGGQFDPSLAQGREQSLREVEPGCRRGDGATFSGKDRLVPVAILRPGSSFDIGWERHLPELLEYLPGRKGAVELDGGSLHRALDDRGGRLLTEFDHLPSLCVALEQNFPQALAQCSNEHQFQPSTTGPLASHESGGQNLCVIHDEEIAKVEQRGQVHHTSVRTRPRRTRHDQQASLVARFDGTVSDQRRIERKIKLGEYHQGVEGETDSNSLASLSSVPGK